jgi:endoglucanase
VTVRRDCLRRALGVAGSALLGLPVAPAAASPAPAGGGPSMRRGLNLTHWFEYERGQVVSRDELREMHELGFDHVRLPIDPIVCGWRPEAEHALPFIGELRAAVDDALAAGLEVVVDLHLEPSDKERIEGSAHGQAAVVALWSRLARGLGDLPPQRVAFELFNEPQFYGAAAGQWPAFQQRMLDALRTQAPRHRVLLSGNQGASVEGLQRLLPVRDAAAVYVFHYYAPYLFTHQGAHWMDTRYTTAGLHHGVRYPSAAQAARPARLSRPHPRAAREMAEYLVQDWGPARVAREIHPAGAWARRHGVPVVCNEFGVLRASADPESRYRWIGDVRRALEAEGIGWSLWDYTDIFGITTESNLPNRRGARRIELAALQALGRTPARLAQR